MKGNKKGYVKPKEYIVDFETITANTNFYQENKDTAINYWYAKNLLEEKEVGGDEAEGVGGKSFLEWMLSLKQKTILWFHNISFDGEFIIPLLQLTELKQTMLEFQNNQFVITGYDMYGKLQPKWYDVFRNGKKIYDIEIKHRPTGSRNYVVIHLRCSYNILMSSINSISKAYHHTTFLNQPLKKLFDNEKAMGDAFYDIEPIADLEIAYYDHWDYINYCKRDVEIARKALNDFVKTINEIPTIKKYNSDNLKRNARKSNKNRKDKYTGIYDVLDKGITIASIGRKVLEQIYIPYFQKYSKNPMFNSKYVFKHLEHLEKHNKTGNMSHIDTSTYRWLKDNHFYRGGFTQFNPIFQKISTKVDDGIKLDVSSAYPFHMTKPLPFGPLIDQNEWEKYYADKNYVESIDYIEFNVYKIKKAIPKPDIKHCSILFNYTKEIDPQKNIQYRYNPELQKNFTLSLIKEEFDELCNWYDFEIESIETRYMFCAPFLENAAKELYELKEKYDQLNLPAQKNGTKILLNSLYGSLALGLDYDNYVYVDNDIYDQFETFALEQQTMLNKFSKLENINFKGRSPSCDIEDKKCIRIISEITKQKSWNYAAASVITAKQRVYLYQFIRTIGAKYFGYCDTDSVIFVNFPKDIRDKIKPFESSKLGGWEVEKRYIVSFKTRKAKEYVVEYKAYDESTQQFYRMENGKKVYCDYDSADILEEIKAAGHQLDRSNYKEIARSDSYLNEELIINNSGFRAIKCKSGIVFERFDKKDKLGVV